MADVHNNNKLAGMLWLMFMIITNWQVFYG